jgi:hypothetical protein
MMWAQVAAEACFLSRIGNLSGLSVGCVSAGVVTLPLEKLDPLLYKAYASRFSSTRPSSGSTGDSGEEGREYLAAYEVHDLEAGRMNVTIRYNDTTQVLPLKTLY